MKLMIFGDKRHGKDTACEYLRDKYGVTFASSSEFANKLFLFDKIKDEFGYKTPEECFEDRHNHRQLWYEEIKAFNTPDLANLGRKIFQYNSIYCGIRDNEEFAALKKENLFDVAIWIDASERKPPEGKESMKLSKDDADIIIDNNGSKKALYAQLDAIYEKYLNPEHENSSEMSI